MRWVDPHLAPILDGEREATIPDRDDRTRGSTRAAAYHWAAVHAIPLSMSYDADIPGYRATVIEADGVSRDSRWAQKRDRELVATMAAHIFTAHHGGRAIDAVNDALDILEEVDRRLGLYAAHIHRAERARTVGEHDDREERNEPRDPGVAGGEAAER